jgi:FMN phosphatase YigB (HAD superfamily)
MTSHSGVVFLFDVDDTLLDNDRFSADLTDRLQQEFGREGADRYWEIFEQLRAELGYADYLGALQRYRLRHIHDPNLSLMSFYLLDYPFADRLYPRALDVLARVKAWGMTVILTDGDIVFQPHKIARSGLGEAVDGRMVICIHKERELDHVERRYPADHYVLVDDKLAILAAVKAVWGSRVTTVFVRQGHYARDPKSLGTYPPADLAIDRIGDLLPYNLPALIDAATAQTSSKSDRQDRGP